MEVIGKQWTMDNAYVQKDEVKDAIIRNEGKEIGIVSSEVHMELCL